MSEPSWKTDLKQTVDAWVSGSGYVKDCAFVALLVHVDAAYDRGLMAGRSQANYPTRKKRKEDPCTAAADGPIPASSTDEP
ncbi:hypothetical protein [Streptomyces misionensis]|uniref:hypothetical protein n=1 Tax=Streptomyces misionensis TaxID=67331 RepID=UPI0036C59A15